MDAENFRKYLLINKSVGEVTITGYLGSIKRMEKKIGDGVIKSKIEDYVFDLYKSNYSYSHKTNTVLAIEHYTNFKNTPLKFGRLRKPKRLIPETLSEAEVTKIIFSCKNIREKAVISLIAYSGIRNLELCKLKVKDVGVHTNCITILCGKGSKDGLCHISPECSKILVEYLQVFPRNAEDYLFTTLVKNNRLATGDVRKMVKVVSKRTGSNKRVYPHLLRHSLATNMLIRGCNLMTIKQQLRHVFIETTMSYVDALRLPFRNDYEKYAPSYL